MWYNLNIKIIGNCSQDNPWVHTKWTKKNFNVFCVNLTLKRKRKKTPTICSLLFPVISSLVDADLTLFHWFVGIWMSLSGWFYFPGYWSKLVSTRFGQDMPRPVLPWVNDQGITVGNCMSLRSRVTNWLKLSGWLGVFWVFPSLSSFTS